MCQGLPIVWCSGTGVWFSCAHMHKIRNALTRCRPKVCTRKNCCTICAVYNSCAVALEQLEMPQGRTFSGQNNMMKQSCCSQLTSFSGFPYLMQEKKKLYNYWGEGRGRPGNEASSQWQMTKVLTGSQ